MSAKLSPRAGSASRSSAPKWARYGRCPLPCPAKKLPHKVLLFPAWLRFVILAAGVAYSALRLELRYSWDSLALCRFWYRFLSAFLISSHSIQLANNPKVREEMTRNIPKLYFKFFRSAACCSTCAFKFEKKAQLNKRITQILQSINCTVLMLPYKSFVGMKCFVNV